MAWVVALMVVVVAYVVVGSGVCVGVDGCSDSSCQHPSVVDSTVDSSGCAAVFTLHT